MSPRYDIDFSEVTRMWEVFDRFTGNLEGHFEYVSDAEEFARDLNMVDQFEFEMSVYNEEIY